MRTFLRAAIASVLAVVSLVGPVSAATSESTVMAQASQTTGTLAGRVLDTRQKPVSGATVTVQKPSGTQTATTDGDGRFSFSLPPGLYSIVVNKGGFQGNQTTDIAVASGTSLQLAVNLTEATSESLRVIGRTSSSARTNPINTNSAAVATVTSATITERPLTNVNEIVNELPGVQFTRTSNSATPNTNFAIHGFTTESKTNIDGHPVSSGAFGAYNTNYTNGQLLGSVEILKGAGLNGPTAGESAIGTINYRTRDFTRTNQGDVILGLDSAASGFYSVVASGNTLKDRLSFVFGKSYTSDLGPYDKSQQVRAGLLTGTPGGTGQIPTVNGLSQFIGDFSNRFSTESELAKVRYRLSDATSLTGEFIGFQGQYQPQGGSYGSYVGKTTLLPCFNASAPGRYTIPISDPALCGVTSQYNAPAAQPLVGSTVNAYNWFPNSVVQNNEPYFSAELRTTYKNDTVLLRPYTALVNRFISGALENQYPGNAGGWFQVTNVANCQATFAAPSVANGGAKGPCFTSTASPTASAYIGNDPTLHVYGTTATAPSCSASAPCYTTTTGIQNNGYVGYGTPFSQPEIDRLHGFTFNYIHPVGENTYNFSYDYNSDNTTSFTGDTLTPPPAGTPNNPAAGCTLVVGNVSNSPNTQAYQPGCRLANLPRSGISIPPTTIKKNDFALTAQFQLTSKLGLAFGSYLTNYQANAQIENQNFITNYAPVPAGTTPVPAGAPVNLQNVSTNFTHYDPHFGLTYRVNPNAVLRFTGGSSITTPFASQISGLGSVTLPNAANNQIYTVSFPNANLLPETTVPYDIGADLRLPDGGLFTIDAYYINIFNTFISNQTVISPVAGVTAPNGYYQIQVANGPLQRSFGLDLSLAKTPQLGFGYLFNTSFQRVFLLNLPQSLYATTASNLVNYAQFLGVPYMKAYGQVRFAGTKSSLFTLGADYEGNNNNTNGKPYVIFDSTMRLHLANQTFLQIAGQNIFNYNTGSDLGRALSNQGNFQLTYGPAGFGQRTTQLQRVDFRNFRFSVERRF